MIRRAKSSIPLLALALAAVHGCSDGGPTIEQAREITKRLIVVDGHIDVPYRLMTQREKGEPEDDVSQRTAKGDFDHPRAIEGGLDAFFQSIYTPSEKEDKGAKAYADALIDMVEGIAKSHPDKFAMMRTAAEVRTLAAESGSSSRVGFLMGMENGSPLEHDLANIDHFFARGVRYITLCHAKDNHICDSSYDESRTHRGLSEFGREVVKKLNQVGILIDVSHVSDDAFYQVIAATRAPVIASHSSVRRYTPRFERNMDDDMLRLLAANGGVIMINFGSAFLDQEVFEADKQTREQIKAELATRGLAPGSKEAEAFAAQYEKEHPSGYSTVEKVADHIEHVTRLIGPDHVGLGSDFDGVGDSLPVGLKDVSQYPNLVLELLKRGYEEWEIEKICGGNVLRILEHAERVAAASGR